MSFKSYFNSSNPVIKVVTCGIYSAIACTISVNGTTPMMHEIKIIDSLELRIIVLASRPTTQLQSAVAASFEKIEKSERLR